MSQSKKIIAGAAVVLAVVGFIVCLIVALLSWTLNTSITRTLVQTAAAAERLLGTVDGGLTRMDAGLGEALSAVTTVEESVRSAGDTIVETDLAFLVLERTVGDTLVPRVASAQETATNLTATILAFNDTLEAANRMPFVEVPTLTTELQTAADGLEAARAEVEAMRAEMQTIKEQKVSRPVTFVTERTAPIAAGLDRALTAVDSTQAAIADRQARLVDLQERLPRLIDFISIAVTLVMAWLIAAQVYVFLRMVEYLTGRKLWVRAEKSAGG